MPARAVAPATLGAVTEGRSVLMPPMPSTRLLRSATSDAGRAVGRAVGRVRPVGRTVGRATVGRARPVSRARLAVGRATGKDKGSPVGMRDLTSPGSWPTMLGRAVGRDTGSDSGSLMVGSAIGRLKTSAEKEGKSQSGKWTGQVTVAA